MAICTQLECPSSPNCVSSINANDQKHFVKPFAITTKKNKNQVLDEIVKNLLTMDRFFLVEKLDNTLHFTDKTFLGFVDDIYLYYDQKQNILHIKSKSRLGYYDFNKNKKRYHAIKRKLIEANIIQS
jgi:uncharacterized protein (DUF1499 family)